MRIARPACTLPLWAATALAATILGASGAASAAEPIRFEYVVGKGAERCPDKEAVQNALAARLGAVPFAKDADRLLKASVRRKPKGGFVGSVVLSDRSGVVGERTVESDADNCYELAKAMELAIAIAIDPLAVMAPAPPPSPEEEGPPPPPRKGESEGYRAPEMVVLVPREGAPATTTTGSILAPLPDEEGPPPPPAEADSFDVLESKTEEAGIPWRVFAFGGPTLVYGPTPGLSLGAHLGAGFRYRFVSFQFELRRDLPTNREVTFSEDTDDFVSADRNLVQANVCGHLSIAFGCVGATGSLQYLDSGGLNFGQGNGVYPNLSAALRGGVEIPVFPWLPVLDLFYLRLFADVDAPVFAYNLTVDDDKTIFTTSRLNLGIGANLMVAFP